MTNVRVPACRYMKSIQAATGDAAATAVVADEQSYVQMVLHLITRETIDRTPGEENHD